MSKVRFTLNILAVVIFTLTVASMAQAQATRTWVSGVGDDVNPCSRTAPCKTYAGAISKTARDGEISTLDPGGFGAITITKSITINGGGGGQGYGSILASGTNGVIVNLTDPADLRKTVRLNHLDINGAPSTSPGINGVRILAASVVHVENSFIDSFRSTTLNEGNGIRIEATATVQVHVRNTTIRNNLGAGIRANTSAGQVVLSVVNSKISNNATGIFAATNTVGSIVGSEINSNTTGIDADGAGVQLNVDSCNIAFSTTGVQAGAGASTVRLSNNFITQNGTGVSVAGGTVFTSGTNRLLGNPTPVNGALQAVTLPQ
ncbi:MAG TPA: hypothetical protein VJV03_18865 [Pyrinomonadaceae bacterium]|nr:hypothetical protein [Pyrinomonadaceae bacterium]